MSFGSPWLLLLLLLVPVAVGGYVLLEQHRTRQAERWSRAALLPNMVSSSPGFRRYVPLTLFLLALVLLLAGFARPQATINVPREGAMVVLALDVSGSMEAKDVAGPKGAGRTTRLLAARQTAIDFLDELPDKYRVALVTFGNRGTVKVQPGYDRDRLIAALPTKASPVGTALASGIDSATKAVQTTAAQDDRKPGDPPTPASVLLISDGSNSAQADPHEAAVKASKLGIKIWTVLLGTSGPLAEVRQPLPGGNERLSQVPVVPQTLEDVSRTSGGIAFKARTSEQLAAVYKDLRSQLVEDKKKREITVGLAGAAVVLLLAGALLSGYWFRRLV